MTSNSTRYQSNLWLYIMNQNKNNHIEIAFLKKTRFNEEENIISMEEQRIIQDLLSVIDNANTKRLDELYINLENKDLARIFSIFHGDLNVLMREMNSRARGSRHFLADDSRMLIRIIDQIFELQHNLKDSIFSFEVDDHYLNFLRTTESFLQSSLGSTIPKDYKKYTLENYKPVFHLTKVNFVEIPKRNISQLKFIGEGSYASVHSYIDPFYDRKYAIKIAKKDLIEKELKRFKIEFQQMKRLSSPYILEVYKYDEEKNRYTMELMDCSLEKYMQKNNSNLHTNTRKSLILQILKAFDHIHSNSLFHRDISVNNFLLKEYSDGSLIIKVSDFGLVKSKEHFLTSVTTDVKGHLNVSDNILQTNGFSSYGIINETYALTLIIYYILTGRLNYDNISNENIKNFVMKGISPNGNERYQSIEELHKKVRELFILLDQQGYR